jgi:Asp-tRNA(Asn)/Glu-tRNA(Gln) amidotransferase A subunit family amidase
MTTDDMLWRSALDLAALIRTKQVSPVEITERVLERIGLLNPRLNAYCHVAAEAARNAAREAEIAVLKGEPLGLLHGVPFSAKDVLDTRGIATTYGSRLFAEAVPEHDSVAVGRLRAGRAVILGKTATSEFGHKAITESPLFGVTRNPWNLDCTPGGSSGGAAAAVASGLGPIALGTDGGGSVRIPAAFCGVFGFKPSFGRVPTHPASLGWSHVDHVGPLTRCVRDAAALLDVIAGDDDRDRLSLPTGPESYVAACDDGIKGLHVAWSADLGYATVSPEVRTLCENAAAEFEGLGCHVEVVSPGWENPEGPFSTLIAAQFYAAWSDRLPAAESLMDATLVKFIRRGGGISAREYLLAHAAAEAYWQEVRTFLERFDLLLTPTVAVAAFGAGQSPPREIDGEAVSVLGWMPFTYPFNLTGQPAASVPVGFTESGLPVGLQIVGRRHADRTVLAAARAFETACPWNDRCPPL